MRGGSHGTQRVPETSMEEEEEEEKKEITTK
jgi:hypothetical protein